MGDKQNAQTSAGREMIESLEQEFALLHLRLRELLAGTAAELLYRDRDEGSVAENVLRSAAAIERTFGGITANLWDDPFEWTLPEYLSTPAKLLEYLDEVEALRARAFQSFSDDSCLSQHVATPSGETKPLVELLRKTARAARDFVLHAEECAEQL